MIDSPQAQMGRIKALQEDLVQLQRKIKAQISELGMYLDSTFVLNWEEHFPGRKPEFITGVDGGSMTNRWEPEIYLYSIDGVHPTEAGEWVDQQNLKVQAPVKLDKLQDFCLHFLRLTQVPVKIAYTSPHKDYAIDEND